MNHSYDIFLGGEVAGKAQVTREGLYFRFSCRLRLSGEVIYKLVLQKGEETVDLGIPAPEGEMFTLTTRIPIKRVGDGPFMIRAVPKHAPLDGRFVPLKEDEPIHYLSKMYDAVFTVRDGQPGLMFPEK